VVFCVQAVITEAKNSKIAIYLLFIFNLILILSPSEGLISS
jgi:hypothetical protein